MTNLRTELLTRGFIELPRVASPRRLLRLQRRLDDIYETGEAHRGQISEHDYRRLTHRSLYDSISWFLHCRLRHHFGPLQPSPATTARQIEPKADDISPTTDTPLEFHIDAQLHRDDVLTLNLWLPLTSGTSIDAPGLELIPIPPAALRQFCQHRLQPPYHEPLPEDLAGTPMHHFLHRRLTEPYLASAGLLGLSVHPPIPLGSAILFTNFTIHRTWTGAWARQRRLSLELRYDTSLRAIDGFKPKPGPEIGVDSDERC